VTTTAGTSLALRRAALALLCILALAIAVACGAGDPVIGQPTSGPSRTAGTSGDGTGDHGPTADIEIDPVPAEPTRTFPPGGPVPCDDKFDQPLCFPPREVSPQTLYRELTKRSWDCYREGQKDDAGLEVSDTFECSGTQGKVGQISLHHSISANTYESKKSGPLEEISVVATAAEIGDRSGPKPTDRHVQKHSVRAFTFMLRRIWGDAHPDWVTEATRTFRTMQPNCRTLKPLDNGQSPPTALLSMGYTISCTNPIGFDVEGQTTITQTAHLDAPYDNTAPR
jgi:hypothetical protein